MTDRELLQQALDALESWQKTCLDCGRSSEELGRATKPLQALRTALAQPEHPDAQGSPCPKFWDWLPKAYEQTESFSKYNMEVAYLEGKKAQSERAECDGGQCGIGGYCKQCPKTQPEPEPVAWISDNAGLYHGKPPESLNPMPLYTTPPQREWVGLTDEEYFGLQMKIKTPMISVGDYIDAMRMVEEKLKEKNGF